MISDVSPYEDNIASDNEREEQTTTQGTKL